MSPHDSDGFGAEQHSNGHDEIVVPQISRKVKACAACRKQKVCSLAQRRCTAEAVCAGSRLRADGLEQIKCLMDDSGPPCRRCIDRNLSCVLNKSLQSLLDEKQQ
jgi:hypothetical protein